MKEAALGLGAWISAPAILPSSVLGLSGVLAPSERIAVGLIGAGNINLRHREAFLSEKDAVIVAVCDPVRSRRESYAAHINHSYGARVCDPIHDFRELLDREDLDAVCIGTPDHWHAIMSIEAMKAGKDVYVEKPLTLTVSEGQRVVETAEVSGRILQTGLQRRSMGPYRRACELVRNGRIGRLHRVEVGILSINIGVEPGRAFRATPVPENFDYDLWLGPAPEAPFCPERVARGNEICYWYYISDYTAGFISGNGVHFVDIAQWGMGDEVQPSQVTVTHAEIPKLGLIDDVISWNSEVLYENGVVMGYSSENEPYPDGIRFHGTKGWVHVNGGGQITASHRDILESTIGPEEVLLYDSPGPHRNLLDCIRTRQQPAASPLIGHHATTTCNLVELSARLGRTIQWDPIAGRVTGDEAANRMLSRPMRAPWHV